LALGLTLGDAAVAAISKCDDPVVALLALDCEARNLTNKPLDKTFWTAHMNAGALYDEYWLLAYEANIKAWLPNPGGIDFVAADPNFSLLKAAGVHFYESTINISASPTGAVIPTVSQASGGSEVAIVAGTPQAIVPPAEPAAPTNSAVSG
jgi:hypothetical protein